MAVKQQQTDYAMVYRVEEGWMWAYNPELGDIEITTIDNMQIDFAASKRGDMVEFETVYSEPKRKRLRNKDDGFYIIGGQSDYAPETNYKFVRNVTLEQEKTKFINNRKQMMDMMVKAGKLNQKHIKALPQRDK